MTNDTGPGIESLLDCWEKLGGRERKVICTVAWRLYAGQRRYGPLTLGKKNWPLESLEEQLDSCVYLAAAMSDQTDLAFNRAVADAEAEVVSGAV